MAKKPDAQIKIDIINGKVDYSFGAYHRVEENGMYSWYIPSFRIFFSSKTKEQGTKRSITMTRSFIKYWLERKKSFRGFVLELHHLGFRASHFHDLTVNQILTRKIGNAEFGYMNGHTAEEFKNSKSEVIEDNLAMAV